MHRHCAWHPSGNGRHWTAEAFNCSASMRRTEASPPSPLWCMLSPVALGHRANTRAKHLQYPVDPVYLLWFFPHLKVYAPQCSHWVESRLCSFCSAEPGDPANVGSVGSPTVPDDRQHSAKHHRGLTCRLHHIQGRTIIQSRCLPWPRTGLGVSRTGYGFRQRGMAGFVCPGQLRWAIKRGLPSDMHSTQHRPRAKERREGHQNEHQHALAWEISKSFVQYSGIHRGKKQASPVDIARDSFSIRAIQGNMKTNYHVEKPELGHSRGSLVQGYNFILSAYWSVCFRHEAARVGIKMEAGNDVRVFSPDNNVKRKTTVSPPQPWRAASFRPLPHSVFCW